MSFAFSVTNKGDNWTYGTDETLREVTGIKKLYDVSVVDTPFYDTTSVYARSFELLENNLKQLESLDLRKRKAELRFKLK
jgi:phage head maturation protease